MILASGILHTTATLCLTAAAVPYYGLDKPHHATAALLAGLWAVIVQPDLDQIDNSGYYGLYILEKTGGLFTSKVWRLYWTPYSRFQHRSFWTHFPVISTIVRLIYGGWWFLPFLVNEPGSIFVALVIGADFVHWVMDWKVWGRLGLFRQ